MILHYFFAVNFLCSRSVNRFFHKKRLQGVITLIFHIRKTFHIKSVPLKFLEVKQEVLFFPEWRVSFPW